MKTIDPNTMGLQSLHHFLISSVAPRPIAFVSTMDEFDNPNLAPYSFFNVFSAKPPILVFSSNRRGKENTTKDTFENVNQLDEVVINVVSHDILRQMTICSMNFPKGIDEFEKSGLTPIASEFVRPYRVKEAPVQFECRVQQIIPLGTTGGAGNLIICEVLLIHYNEEIADEKGTINPHKIDLMGRMGQSFYVRASGESIHSIPRFGRQLGIGYDQLPINAQKSTILTGNNLGQLASIGVIPDTEAVLELKSDPEVFHALKEENPVTALHKIAQRYLDEENISRASKVVWLVEYL